jgi:uncharacterized protein YjbI with pentapeptide repeats
MADPEHLRLIFEGSDAISSHRRDTQQPLDLSGANLSGINLSFANLLGANLNGVVINGGTLTRCLMDNVRLEGAKLRASLNNNFMNDANLTSATIAANLTGSVLYRANFTGADLSRSSLSWCKLRAAILDRAILRETRFQFAEMPFASLRNARCERMDLIHTVLIGADLSGATGLESINFRGPVFIDHQTILRSGDLPRTFLQGCGLPDEVIEFYVSQAATIQYCSCFISYSRRDEGFVNRLHADLQQSNIRCWLDVEHMRIGDRTRPVINEAIRLHDKLLLVLSQHSIESAWVESEVEAAFERERRERRTVLFPIRLDDAVMDTDQAWAAEIRRTRNIGDFRNWKNFDQYAVSLERLIRDLRR